MAFLLVKFIPELLYNQWITVTQTFISTPYFHLSLCPIWAWLLVAMQMENLLLRKRELLAAIRILTKEVSDGRERAY